MKYFPFLKTLQIKIPTLWGRGLWVGRLRQPKHPTSTKQAKNETAAGVALVLATAVGFTMHIDHKLLGEEGVGEL